MIGHGDDFRVVTGDAARIALEQHFAIQGVPLDCTGPRHAAGDISGRRPNLEMRMPMAVRRIIKTELALHGVEWDEWARASNRPAARKASLGVYEAIRTQMAWKGKAPTVAQIARWCGRNSSTVYAAIYYSRHRKAGNS